MRARLPIVGVVGSGTSAHADKALPLGRLLASCGVHLLTGGGGGVMQAVSQGFFETVDRRGMVIGVLPWESTTKGPPKGYPNPFVEIPIQTHLPWSGERGEDPLSRNHINVLSADLVIALPGSSGTASEIRLALRYGKRVVVFGDHPEQIPGTDRRIPLCFSLKEVAGWLKQSGVTA